MWKTYYDNKPIGKRIKGISKKYSLWAAKRDGGCGVVSHPETGEPIFWEGE